MQPAPRTATLLTLSAGVVVFIALNHVIFASLLYPRWLEPQSRAGTFVHRAWFEQRRAQGVQAREILLLGDSSMAEGFSEREARALTKDAPAILSRAAGGSGIAAWAHLAGAAVDAGKRYEGIVIGVKDYLFRAPRPMLVKDVLIEFQLIFPFWSWRSWLPALRSSSVLPQFPDRARVLRHVLAPGLFYTQDLALALADWPARAARAEQWRDHNEGNFLAYGGRGETLGTMAVDGGRVRWQPQAGTIQNPALQEKLQKAYDDAASPKPHDVWPYQLPWLRSLARAAKRCGAKLFIVRMPHYPFPELVERNSGIDPRFAELVRDEGIVLVPDAFVKDLSRPEYFFDFIHLN